MTKADDSSLDPDQRRAVEQRAHKLLDRASAWQRFPTPIEDILAAANLKVAPHGIFDPAQILAYLRKKAVETATTLKNALTKVFGIYDANDFVIHIDNSVVESKQTFLKLHETGHHELPTHRKIFRIFQDCEETLKPEISDLFEREANNFARFMLFQGDGFARMAADCAFEIKTPMKLAKKFGASIYASAREYARTNHRACIVYVLEPVQMCEEIGFSAVVRRIEPSPSFEQQFGRPVETVVTPDHYLGDIVPLGRKMTRPTAVVLTDKNGVRHECLAEAFDTTYNVLILLYPVKALTASTIIVPSGFKAVANF
ncbi:MAG: ImmA/IrrE family metallo-endopeptidase [Formivibrio sp.]|nr:ImmA/IrrE family metallo-endopeptidase [Formivibrio sp.]